MRQPFLQSCTRPVGWFALLALAPSVFGQAHPLRGLWVGQASLRYATEVSVPLNAQNQPVAPDPRVPTPTSDQAEIRVLLHVNGAGQAFLLRDVAVVNRIAEPAPGTVPSSVAGSSQESDLALVTDPSLYGAFPPQAAVRISSAVFDFGDSRSSAAVDEVVRRVAEAAGNSVAASSADFTGTAGRSSATSAAATAALAAGTPVLSEADAATAFGGFMRNTLTSLAVDGIAESANPVLAAAAVRAAAVSLQTSSFYGDSRAVEMVDAVVASVQAHATPAAKKVAAHNTASAFADLANDYQRFLAGKVLGDLIVGASSSAATAATQGGATLESVQAAMLGHAAVVAGRREALLLRVPLYRDTRATMAVDTVLASILGSVTSALPVEGAQTGVVEAAAVSAGRQSLAENVIRYRMAPTAPSPAYTSFVSTSAFADSPQTAANAAAAAAVSARANDSLYTTQSLVDAARVAAATALQSVYAAAARAVRTELPLTGDLAVWRGDTRFAHDIRTAGGAPLGLPGLTGEIVLPASHPTHPFRHRQNPDHRIGFDITRVLRFDFDGTPDSAPVPAAHGVHRLTGTYREEVHGLHKPLGPSRDIGLKVEGRLELRRISLIDALNAR